MGHRTDRFPELETERLVLGEITKGHDEWYLRHFSIPEIVDGQGFDAPKDIEAAREELDKYIVGLFREGDGIRWGIRLKNETEFVGSAGFYSWDKHSRRARMGYDLRPERWGNGLMTEAMRRIIRYGFEDMDLNRIEVTIMATNERSIAMAERLGFKREGVMREYSVWKGAFVDEYPYSILASEWRSREQS